jgi:uncharacterized protein YjdB
MKAPVRGLLRLTIVATLMLAGVACEELRTSTEPLPIGSTLLVAPGADTIFVGDSVASADSVRFVAVARTWAGDTVELTGAQWESSDTLVATVDSTGLVTARGIGVAVITALAGEKATATIVIVPATATLVLLPATDTLLLGDSLQLFAQAYDANSAPVTGVRYDFASGNTGIATVDSLGLVRTVAPGDARITVSAAGRQAFSDLTVLDSVPLLPPPTVP